MPFLRWWKEGGFFEDIVGNIFFHPLHHTPRVEGNGDGSLRMKF
jgi:hypothetical protein